jgi:positive regulator of sigma E activity
VNDIALVTELDRDRLLAQVTVYPASCGRCDDEGHCTRRHREMTVRVQPDVSVVPGEHVRLEPAPGALWRGVTSLLLLPGIFGLAGYVTAGLLGASSGTAWTVAGVLGVLPVTAALLRGTSPKDRPIIVERLAGTAAPEFRPLSLSRVSPRPDTVVSVSE